MTKALKYILSLAYLFLCFEAQSQSDSSYIKDFEKCNVVETFPGVYRNAFEFTGRTRRQGNFKLLANGSCYLGFYVHYKWASFHYAFTIPGTQLDDDTKFKYTDLSFRFTTTSLLIQPFLNTLNGLLIPERRKREYLPARDIKIMSVGSQIYYYPNANRYSFQAANYLSQLQKRNAGSIVLSFCPQWQQISSAHPSSMNIIDSNTVKLLRNDPQWMSVTGRIGYAYTLVFYKGRWTVSPTLLEGKGLIHEFRGGNRGLQSTSNYQATLNASYNTPSYYFYITAFADFMSTHLLIRDLNQKRTDVSLTVGYRFRNLDERRS